MARRKAGPFYSTKRTTLETQAPSHRLTNQVKPTTTTTTTTTTATTTTITATTTTTTTSTARSGNVRRRGVTRYVRPSVACVLGRGRRIVYQRDKVCQAKHVRET